MQRFPGLYVVGGIQGNPKEDCGETVYVVIDHDGLQVEGFTMLIVNQTRLAKLIKANEKAIKQAASPNLPQL